MKLNISVYQSPQLPVATPVPRALIMLRVTYSSATHTLVPNLYVGQLLRVAIFSNQKLIYMIWKKRDFQL